MNSAVLLHKVTMLTDAFNATIDKWIKIINNNSFDALCKKPNEESWSAGQVCIHLLKDTNWFIEQVHICLSSADNSNECMTTAAKSLFANNSFPNAKLANPNNANMPQPESKEQLMNGFIKLKKDINDAAEKLNNNAKGKTKHPGYGYLDATEWLQFAEMHMRHHLKQKNLNPDFLN